MAGKTHHGLSNFGLSRPHNNPALFFFKLVSENEGTVVLRLKTQQQTLSPAAKTLQLDLHETTIDYILPNEKKHAVREHTFVALLRALVVGAVPCFGQNNEFESLEVLAERCTRVRSGVERSPRVGFAPQSKHLHERSSFGWDLREKHDERKR